MLDRIEPEQSVENRAHKPGRGRGRPTLSQAGGSLDDIVSDTASLWKNQSTFYIPLGSGMGTTMAKATLSDIAACFRVLLEREPAPEEIAVHAKAHIGNDLADVVKQYLESQEFRNRRIVQIVSGQPDKFRAAGP